MSYALYVRHLEYVYAFNLVCVCGMFQLHYLWSFVYACLPVYVVDNMASNLPLYHIC